MPGPSSQARPDRPERPAQDRNNNQRSTNDVRRSSPAHRPPLRNRSNDTPAPVVQPINSELFKYIESISAISRGKNKLFLPAAFQARSFMQEAVRFESVYDPASHPFHVGLIDGWDSQSGYGFLRFNHPQVKQDKFFFHAAGYEEPVIKAVFPSEQAPYTLLSVTSSKKDREKQRVPHHKDKQRKVQRHCCPPLQIDEPISFARWNDKERGNEYAGRWMPSWIHQRILEVSPQLEMAIGLLFTYRLVLLNDGDGDGTPVMVTNFPFAVASAIYRLEPLLGAGQELHILNHDNPYVPYERAELAWNRQPLTRYVQAVTEYLTKREATMPDFDSFA